MKKLSKIFTVFILSIMIFSLNSYADSDKLLFRKSAYMTNLLEINKNVRKEDSVLFEVPLNNKQEHTLTYFLNSQYKNKVAFDLNDEGLSVKYSVISKDGTNITDTLLDGYMEMSYKQNVPDWHDVKKEVNSDGDLQYLISKSASSNYTGLAFNLNGTEVIVKWDISKNVVYYQTSGYNAGYIMPVSLNTTFGNYEMKVIKALKNFEVKSTHYENVNGVNKNLNPYLEPTESMAGTKEGMDIFFEQPKVFDSVSWDYIYADNLDDIEAIVTIAEIADSKNAQFSFKLSKSDGGKVYNAENEADNNAQVTHSYRDNKYGVKIVKDKTNLNSPNSFIQWDDLNFSSIYDVKVSLQLPLDDTFKDYSISDFYPKGGYGFTYVKYDIVRTSQSEAFLKVYPYFLKDEEIEYLVLNSTSIHIPLDINEDLWLKSFHKSKKADDVIFIPIKPKSEAFQDNYQIVMKFSGQKVYSQIITYNASQDSDYPVATPRIKSVDNVVVLHNENGELLKTMFDITFTAPKNKKAYKELDKAFEKLGENGHLYYELYINDEPKLSDEKPYSMVKVFEVVKQNGKYTIKEVSPDGVDKGVGASYYDFENGYNASEDTFRMDKIVLGDSGYVKAIEYKDGSYKYSDKNINALDGDINFFRIKAVTRNGGDSEVSDMSLPYSISLSDSSKVVPIVDYFSYVPVVSNKKGGKVELKIRAVDSKLYEKTMLVPIGKSIKKQKYRVYLAKDKDALVENMVSQPLDVTESGTNLDGIKYINIVKSDLDKLSSGKVLHFDLDKEQIMKILLTGLEPKSVVNGVVRTIFEIDDDSEVTSKISGILQMTVSSDFINPNEEKVPLAPDDFEVVFNDDTNLSSKISFKVPKGYEFKNNGVGFEIVSIKGSRLNQKYSSETLEQIVSKYDAIVAEGIRAMYVDGVLKFERITKDGTQNIDEKLFKKTLDEIEIIDDKNSPNSLYYYYVRTVSLDGATIKGKSAFLSDTITTDNIKAPKNLKLNKDYIFSEKYQTIVEFDGAVSDASDIPDKYEFELFVKEDDGSYYKPFYSLIDSKKSNLTGYTKFIYKISGLKSGRVYSVKVQAVDKTNGYDHVPNGSKVYPKSAYSNVIKVRTMFSQSDYDKEQKYKKYSDFFKKKAREVLQKEYYTLYETKSYKKVVYKPDYLQNVLDGNKIKLKNFDKRKVAYYVPSAYLKKMRDDDVKLEISAFKNTVTLDYDALKSVIKKANEDVEKRYGRDYYVELILYNEKISDRDSKKYKGKKFNSYIVKVEPISIVYRVHSENLSQEIEKSIESFIRTRTRYLIDEMSNKVRPKDDELLKISKSYIVDFNEDFANHIEKIFHRYVYDSYAFDEFDKKITYALNSFDKDYLCSLYENIDGKYVKVSDNYYGNKYYYDSDKVHKFVLLSRGDFMDKNVVKTVNKYDLDNVLNDYEMYNTKLVTSKKKYLDMIANVLGVSKFELIEMSGVSRDGMDSSIKRGDAYYVFLKAYENVFNTNLKNVFIYDYYIASDINDVNKKYRKDMLRGLNLGVIKTDNGYINPNSNIDMAGVMELIDVLNGGNE